MYIGRSLSVHRPLGGSKAPSYEKTTQMFISNAKNEVLIEVNDCCCKLMKSSSKMFADLIGVDMSPGQLLYVLQRRGLNFLPLLNDFERIPALPQPCKNTSLELSGSYNY